MTFRKDSQCSEDSDQADWNSGKNKKFQSIESIKSYHKIPQETSPVEDSSCLSGFNRKVAPLKGFFFAFLTAVSLFIKNIYNIGYMHIYLYIYKYIFIRLLLLVQTFLLRKQTILVTSTS
jgi:hypothetical protein